MYGNCGECAFHSFEDGDWICTNEDSEFYCEYTNYNDKCSEFAK